MPDSGSGNPEAFFARHGGGSRKPALIRETLAVLRDPSCSAADLVQVLEKEPGVSSRLLKAANSAFFGTPKSITSLKAAVVRLGNHNVSRIALAVSLGASGGGTWTGFWKHSISVGMLARHIAGFMGRFSRQEEEEFFSMGLLHDLGILIEMDSPEFARAGDALGTGSLTLSEAETLVFGFDHAGLGRIAAEAWNFPGDLVDAIAFHHQPEASRDFYSKIVLVHLADLVCHGFQIVNVPGEGPPLTQEAYLQEAGLPVEQLVLFGDWLAARKAEIDAFGDLMGS